MCDQQYCWACLTKYVGNVRGCNHDGDEMIEELPDYDDDDDDLMEDLPDCDHDADDLIGDPPPRSEGIRFRYDLRSMCGSLTGASRSG